GDPLDDLLVLLHDLIALEAGEATEPPVDDRLRLLLGEFEALLQAVLRGLLVLRLTDRLDDRVQVVEGDLEAFEEVGPVAGALELVARAARQDVATMINVV